MGTPAPAEIETVVVGGGIVGVAIARALARRGDEVVLIEAERALGRHATSRNSEVIHAGLYYPPGSLRATLCVAGRRALYDWCVAHGVGHRRTGKLVIATEPAHHGVLDRIEATARANGVDDVQRLDAAQVRAREPAIVTEGALWSPSTGIIDSHGLLAALWGQARDAGAQVALATAMRRAEVRPRGFTVVTDDAQVHCRRLVLAAGIATQALAAATAGFPAAAIPPQHLAKGTYFRIDTHPFRHLVYPVPDTASLGIHVTLDLGGGARFGPDQQWVDEVDYAVDPARASGFVASVTPWFPGLRPEALRPDYAGVRSKVHGPGEPPADFVVVDRDATGIDGLVALFGIESPGLTACLPLAELVADRLGSRSSS